MKPAPKWRSSGVNSSKPIRIATPEDTVEVKTYIEEFVGEPLAMLLTMLTAVFRVLLIACVNVANLLLARAAARTREVAVRTAIGATRWQVVRQMMLEVLVLAGVGAGVGLGLAQLGITLFNRGIVDTNRRSGSAFASTAPCCSS